MSRIFSRRPLDVQPTVAALCQLPVSSSATLARTQSGLVNTALNAMITHPSSAPGSCGCLSISPHLHALGDHGRQSHLEDDASMRRSRCHIRSTSDSAADPSQLARRCSPSAESFSARSDCPASQECATAPARRSRELLPRLPKSAPPTVSRRPPPPRHVIPNVRLHIGMINLARHLDRTCKLALRHAGLGVAVGTERPGGDYSAPPIGLPNPAIHVYLYALPPVFKRVCTTHSALWL